MAIFSFSSLSDLIALRSLANSSVFQNYDIFFQMTSIPT
jgi:hypothetical protein